MVFDISWPSSLIERHKRGPGVQEKSADAMQLAACMLLACHPQERPYTGKKNRPLLTFDCDDCSCKEVASPWLLQGTGFAAPLHVALPARQLENAELLNVWPGPPVDVNSIFRLTAWFIYKKHLPQDADMEQAAWLLQKARARSSVNWEVESGSCRSRLPLARRQRRFPPFLLICGKSLLCNGSLLFCSSSSSPIMGYGCSQGK